MELNKNIRDVAVTIPETVNVAALLGQKKLSIDFEAKLSNKIKDTFTEDEQTWYITNLYMFLNYHQTNDYPINLEHVYKMIGFANKGNAKRTLEKHFTIDEDYKIALLQTEKRKNEGGYNNETIMLNIDTFKELCMFSKTDKGKDIRKYYIKLEGIFNTLFYEELRENEIQKEKLLLEQQTKHIKEKETLLLNHFHKKYLVYLILIDDKLFKFGFSKDLRDRLSTHKREIGPKIQLIYCIETPNHVDLESKLKTFLDTTSYRRERIFNGKNQTELIEIDDISIIQKQLVKINAEIELAKDVRIQELRVEVKEIDTLRLDVQELHSEVKEIDTLRLDVQELKRAVYETDEMGSPSKKMKNNTQSEIDSITIDNSTDIDIDSSHVEEKIDALTLKFTNFETKLQQKETPLPFNIHPARKNGQGFKIQQIHPRDLSVVHKVYESYQHAARQFQIDNPHETTPITAVGITRAVEKNITYKEYRWCKVAHGLDEYIVHGIWIENIMEKESPRNLVVKLNHFGEDMDSRKITEVFNSQMEALLNAGLKAKSRGAMSGAIKNETKCAGHYYKYWHDCTEQQQNHFADSYGWPVRNVQNGRSIKCKSVDPKTGETVVYNTIEEIRKKFAMNRKTLFQSIERKTLLHNYIWEYC